MLGEKKKHLQEISADAQLGEPPYKHRNKCDLLLKKERKITTRRQQQQERNLDECSQAWLAAPAAYFYRQIKFKGKVLHSELSHGIVVVSGTRRPVLGLSSTFPSVLNRVYVGSEETSKSTAW